MKLLLKFNLVFIVVFLLGWGATAYVTRQLLERNAQQEVLQHARFMLEKALAVRSYTSTQVAPLLETQMKYSFLPQSVPAFSATEVLAKLAKTYPEYSYKEATLNPTNPRDRAVEWEVGRHLGIQEPARAEGIHRPARHAGRPLAVHRAADQDREQRLPEVPQQRRQRAAHAGRQVRPVERLRLAHERSRRRAGGVGADGGAAAARHAGVAACS